MGNAAQTGMFLNSRYPRNSMQKKKKIVAQNKPAEKSQTALPILGADLGLPFEHTPGSLGRGVLGLEDRAQIFLQAQLILS